MKTSDLIPKLGRRQRRWLRNVVRDLIADGQAQRWHADQVWLFMRQRGLVAEPAFTRPVNYGKVDVEVTTLGLAALNDDRLAAVYLLGAKASA